MVTQFGHRDFYQFCYCTSSPDLCSWKF